MTFWGFSILGFSQNKNLELIDEIDYKTILNEQGISYFKNLLTLKRGEYIDVNIDVYEKGKLVESYNQLDNLIKFMEKSFGSGIQLNYHVSKKDTIINHRFYFFKKEDSLKIVINSPGIKTTFKYGIQKIKESDIYQIPNISNDIDQKTLLGIYYGIFKDNGNDWLECPSGLSVENLLKKFDLVILIYGEKKKGD
jgi:hypothetical protein